MSFLRNFAHFSPDFHRHTIPLSLARPECEMSKTTRKENAMYQIPINISARSTRLRKIPTCSGRRQGYSSSVVKGCRQASRPTVLRRTHAMTGTVGLLYSDGRLSPGTATSTLAGSPSRNREYGRRLPQPDSGQSSEAFFCGVITKLLSKRNRDRFAKGVRGYPKTIEI